LTVDGCWLKVLRLEANPAIRSQTLPPNNGVKGFPLLSGLGHYRNQKPREGLPFCAGVRRKRFSGKPDPCGHAQPKPTAELSEAKNLQPTTYNLKQKTLILLH